MDAIEAEPRPLMQRKDVVCRCVLDITPASVMTAVAGADRISGTGRGGAAFDISMRGRTRGRSAESVAQETHGTLHAEIPPQRVTRGFLGGGHAVVQRNWGEDAEENAAGQSTGILFMHDGTTAHTASTLTARPCVTISGWPAQARSRRTEQNRCAVWDASGPPGHQSSGQRLAGIRCRSGAGGSNESGGVDDSEEVAEARRCAGDRTRELQLVLSVSVSGWALRSCPDSLRVSRHLRRCVMRNSRTTDT